jgi:hypothetical protein
VKAGIRISDPTSQLLFLPFFIFSLLAIGWIQNETTAQRDFLPGYRGIGMILSFTMLVILLGAGLVLFCLPYLTLAAAKGYGIIKTAAIPFGPILISILRFIFARGVIRPENPSPPATGGIGNLTSPVESSWWMNLFEKILTWLFGGLIGLIILVVTGLALFFLFRWLLSRTRISQKRHSTRYSILLWVERLRLLLLSWLQRIRNGVKCYKGAVHVYTALLTWGRRSGLPHFLSETPMEYGLRLKARFPSLKGEIELIIEAFHQEVYGEIILDERQLALTRFAWRRLRSPIYWPSRLKTWFLKPPYHTK